MARKKIREFDAKNFIRKNLNLPGNSLLITGHMDISKLTEAWLQGQLIIKPDQCFGKRKKLNLIQTGDLATIKLYLKQHMNQPLTIKKATDKLTHFILEPYIPHQEEYYISFTSMRDGDVIRFSEQGGVDIEENWQDIKEMFIPTLNEFNSSNLTSNTAIQEFLTALFQLYRKNFSYLEINPFTIANNQIHLLDTVATSDTGDWNFPQPFGKTNFPEEAEISNLDQHSGSSLKLTLLNPKGRIWNILSGGGGSMIYLDTIADLGQAAEIANYGEYSGNPTIEESYQYAKRILNLMTQHEHPEGKILFICGGIANFTNIKKTFTGIIQALKEYQQKLREGKVSLYVRRGGPEYEAGLTMMKNLNIGIPIRVCGPDTPMVEIIPEALQ
jgi:ATP-citrate lyase beta-subunit